MKKHISLIVLADDHNKTPLANTKTEVLSWWESLTPLGKKKVVKVYAPELESFHDVKWEHAIKMYKQTHNTQ